MVFAPAVTLLILPVKVGASFKNKPFAAFCETTAVPPPVPPVSADSFTVAKSSRELNAVKLTVAVLVCPSSSVMV